MNETDELHIDPTDARALDFLIAAQFDPASIDRMPQELRVNARRLLGELAQIDSYPVAPPNDALVDATLARIAQEERRQAERMNISSQAQPSFRRRFGLPNILAVAAVLIVAAGVAIPVAGQVRQGQSQALCASGLRTLGGGLSAYSADNRGVMPMAAGIASFLSDSNSNNVAATDSGILDHARHLDMLSSKGYCDAKCTRCNGSRNLSYRIPLHRSQIHLSAMSRSPVAADANPVQTMLRKGIIPGSFDCSSVNHDQRGQNVLFTDGSVVWMVSPIAMQGPMNLSDNFWVIREKNGRESMNIRAHSGSPLEILLAN